MRNNWNKEFKELIGLILVIILILLVWHYFDLGTMKQWFQGSYGEIPSLPILL
jgi:hypothetical protein